MIIFNLGALIQAIVFVIIGYILHITGIWNSFFDIQSLSLQNKNIIATYFIFFISSIMHKIGIKGKLFFIPIWLISLVLIFIINFGNKNEEIAIWYNTLLTYLNYILPIILFFITINWHHDNIETVENIKEVDSVNKQNS